MKKTIALFCVLGLCFASTPLFAQSISGVVTDEDGMALIGTNVLVQNTTIGATTDANGRFELNYDGGFPVTLVVSYIGYVAYISHLIAQVFQVPKDQVKREKSTAVPKMHIAVDGRSANVHANGALVYGNELFFVLGQRVVNGKILSFE